MIDGEYVQRILGRVRKAVQDFDMIDDGDGMAIGFWPADQRAGVQRHTTKAVDGAVKRVIWCYNILRRDVMIS